MTKGSAGVSRSAKSATVSMEAMSGSMPVLMASAPISDMMASICARRNCCGTRSTADTPRVFWAVRAVSAVVANPPNAMIALMSAWIPAPPPLSDPGDDENAPRLCMVRRVAQAVVSGVRATAAMTSQTSPTMRAMSASSSASAMTRMSGSVPLGRMSRRPSGPSAASAAVIAALTRASPSGEGPEKRTLRSS